MGDFSDDYGGYDILGLYDQREDKRIAQRAKLLTPLTKRVWVDLTYEQESELIRLAHNHAGIRFYIRAAQAKLKELNT